MGMLRRAASIIAEMIPGLDLWIRSAILAAMGGMALHLAPYMPLNDWIRLGGKFFLIVSVYWLLLPSLETFLKHASAFVRHRGAQALEGLVTVALVPVLFVHLLRRKDSPTWMDDNGDVWDGARHGNSREEDMD